MTQFESKIELNQQIKTFYSNLYSILQDCFPKKNHTCLAKDLAAQYDKNKCLRKLIPFEEEKGPALQRKIYNFFKTRIRNYQPSFPRSWDAINNELNWFYKLVAEFITNKPLNEEVKATLNTKLNAIYSEAKNQLILFQKHNPNLSNLNSENKSLHKRVTELEKEVKLLTEKLEGMYK